MRVSYTQDRLFAAVPSLNFSATQNVEIRVPPTPHRIVICQ